MPCPRNLSNTMLVFIVTFFFVSVAVFEAVHVFQSYQEFNRTAQVERDRYVAARKETIKTAVDHALSIISMEMAAKDRHARREETQGHVLAVLGAIKGPEVGYLFAGTYEGVSLPGPARGGNMREVTDARDTKVVQELIKAAQRGGGFVEYVMPPVDGQRPSLKLSYAAPVGEWGWYVGAGTYPDEIDRILENQRGDLRSNLITRLGHTAAFAMGMCILIVVVGFVRTRDIPLRGRA